MQILTHRGLEPEKHNFFAESSWEAFQNHLIRGYGIEFDTTFTKDNKILIAHDKGLQRYTRGKDIRQFSNINSEEIAKLELANNSRFCFLTELLGLIQNSTATAHALHIKGHFQNKQQITLLTETLIKYPNALNKLILFDVTPDTAELILNTIPTANLAPSVAHPFDIERYNLCTNNTLLTLEKALERKDIYTTVWLDEWDRKDRGEKLKKFYTEDVFCELKAAEYHIAVVSPELHASSPGLLGGESHQDALNKTVLEKRVRKIIKLDPDYICTDYPTLVQKIKTGN